MTARITMNMGARQIHVQSKDVERLLLEGWSLPSQLPLFLKETETIDSGPIKAKPAKKKAPKAAETAPEAAQEDLGNDIKQGE